MKTILFISYYFPPSANSGSHRVLRLAKGVSRHNWKSIVITTKNGYWGRNPRIDHGLEDSFRGDVYRSKLFYPYKDRENSLIARLIRRIWSEVSFPDDKITWAVSAAVTACNLMRKEKIDCVFVTGPPYSSFLIGYVLKTVFKTPVCLDYRDPWTGSRYYMRSRWKHFFCKVLEKQVLTKVDRAYSVTPKMTEFIARNVLKDESARNKFDTLTYSFSTEDYAKEDSPIIASDKFILSFAGNSFGVGDPGPLLKAVLELKNIRKDVYRHLFIIVIGNLLDNWRIWIEEQDLSDKVQIFGYMTYKKALRYMKASHMLLLPYRLHEHMELCLPVKLYDYLALQKPILFYGPQGQLWSTITETRTGYCRLPHDIYGIMEDIGSVYDKYYSGNEVFAPDVDFINLYRTDVVIRRFVSDIESLTAGEFCLSPTAD